MICYRVLKGWSWIPKVSSTSSGQIGSGELFERIELRSNFSCTVLVQHGGIVHQYSLLQEVFMGKQ